MISSIVQGKKFQGGLMVTAINYQGAFGNRLFNHNRLAGNTTRALELLSTARTQGKPSLEVASFRDDSGKERFEVKIGDSGIEHLGLAPVIGLRHIPSDRIVTTEIGDLKEGTYVATLGFQERIQPNGEYEVLFGEEAHRDLPQPTWPLG